MYELDDLWERPQRKNLEVDLVPLINVIFLLIIFFLVAGTIKMPDTMRVDIPLAQNAEMNDESGLVILLSARGDIVLNNGLINQTMLASALKHALRNNPHLPITVKADANMPAKRLFALMRQITESGGTNLSVATQAPATTAKGAQ